MENLDLSGKRILFIGQKFFDYHLFINMELKKLGADVTFFENKFHECDIISSTSPFLSLCARVIKGDTKKKYQDFILSQISSLQFDFVFVIGGFSISRSFIEKLKILNPHSKSILFLWDSLSYWRYSDIVDSFDKSYTFDRADSIRYNINYLPDFYLSSYGQNADRGKYYLSHIGSVHLFALHRIDVLEKLKRQLDSLGYANYLTIYAPKLFNSLKHYFIVPLRFCFDSLYRKFVWRVYVIGSPLITHKRLSLQEVDQIERESLAIIDLPPKNQVGNSIRAITCIASCKKLITTNKEIINEEFYCSNNIYVVDTENPLVDIKFWTSPTSSVDCSNLQLKEWLLTLIH